MGGSVATPAVEALARELGRLIAENGWVLLSGGRPTGVMAAVTAGAHEAGGLTVGVLFDTDREGAAPGTDIVIPTGLGAGRNVVNVLASDVVVACPGTGGTLSEVALALRFERPVVLLDFDPGAEFLKAAGPGPWRRVATPADAVAQVRRFLKELGRG
jgi:uncharacterized protein (TIGR00725 family)